VKGLEIGGRVEWRWDRFSFALSDFWGYDDYPYLKAVFYYTRNVDPITGRPRTGQSQAGCDPDNLHGGDTSGCLTPDQALAHQSANQQRFAVICASSIGFNNLDPSVCAQSVLNSNRNLLTSAPDVAPTIAETLSDVIAGSTYGKRIVQNPAFAGVPLPLVSLNADYNDGPGGSVVAPNDSLAAVLTDQQEALLGCGAFYHTSCDVSTSQAYGGIDLLNTEMSVMIQSWPGFPGTWNDWSTQSGPNGPIQPGTIRNCSAKPGSVGCGGLQGWVAFAGGTVARRYEGGNVYTLPGARSPWSQATELSPSLWNAGVDGCARAVNPATGLPDPGCQLSNGGAGAHDLVVPTGGAFSTQYSGDPFQSEMAALSWNFMVTLVSLSGIGKPNVACPANTLPSQRSGCRLIDEFLPSDPNGLQLRPGGQPGCSLAKPQLCANIQAIYAVAHTTRRSVIAGGNGTFGRTDFDWHQGGSGVLEYKKRNVLGFSMDFAEDRTKSNWGIESTWIEGNQFEDHDSVSGLSTSSTLNLTVSVDRPTFINFLNRGRTFFFNSQWFFQYVPGYHSGFVSTGPFNVLATFHVDTGYFRDRLLPAITIVYDLKSHSGAILPELAYRFTENLSATISLNLFSGRFQKVTPPLYSVADFPYRAGRDQKWDWTEQGLSPVRDNDEIALRLRYTY
jgi:hypothetical protein